MNFSQQADFQTEAMEYEDPLEMSPCYDTNGSHCEPGFYTGPWGNQDPCVWGEVALHTEPGSSLLTQLPVEEGEDWSVAAVRDSPSLQIWRGCLPRSRPPPHVTMNEEVINLCEVSLCEGCEATHHLLHSGDQHMGPLHLHAAFTEEAKTREGKHPSQGFKASQSGHGQELETSLYKAQKHYELGYSQKAE